MHEAKEIAHYINAELIDADQYAYEAEKHKGEMPDAARAYYNLAKESMERAETLYKMGADLIDPKDVAASEMWQLAHDMMSDKMILINHRLDMYKA